MKMLQDFKEPFTSFTPKEQEGTIFNTLTSPNYICQKEAFAHWLRLLNFEPSTVRYAPAKIHEFLSWIESNGIPEASLITKESVSNYFEYLKNRQKRRKGGRLSKNSLRSHVTTMRRFARYLRESEGETFEVSLQIKGKHSNVKDIFNHAEIKALYEATTDDILGLRDRAMLGVYYGCGLRRNEGVSLDVNDVILERNLLHVRSGKNFKERYVPISDVARDDIKNYIDGARLILLKHPTNALFLSQYGMRLRGQSMINRLSQLKEKAGIESNTSLHSLRHSIATHLLQSGMDLEKIKQFLGHSSLESTQIYTHIVNENR